jgi:hypothetical protein
MDGACQAVPNLPVTAVPKCLASRFTGPLGACRAFGALQGRRPRRSLRRRTDLRYLWTRDPTGKGRSGMRSTADCAVHVPLSSSRGMPIPSDDKKYSRGLPSRKSRHSLFSRAAQPVGSAIRKLSALSPGPDRGGARIRAVSRDIVRQALSLKPFSRVVRSGRLSPLKQSENIPPIAKPRLAGTCINQS